MSETNFTADRIAADRDICDKATKGPWKSADDLPGIVETCERNPRTVCGCGNLVPKKLNAAFIASARTRWPEYIAEVERLRGIIAKAPHDERCSAAKSHHLPGYIHYETDAGKSCPSYHYGLGKCDCWKSKAEVA